MNVIEKKKSKDTRSTKNTRDNKKCFGAKLTKIVVMFN